MCRVQRKLEHAATKVDTLKMTGSITRNIIVRSMSECIVKEGKYIGDLGQGMDLKRNTLAPKNRVKNLI